MESHKGERRNGVEKISFQKYMKNPDHYLIPFQKWKTFVETLS